MEHLMIDFETLSTDNMPALLSIGAVAFDVYELHTFKEFYRNIDIQSSIDLGGTVSASTFLWWLNQNHEARQKIVKQENPTNIKLVFEELSEFYKDNKVKYVWGHGATFDVNIAENYFNKLRIKVPWQYYNARDTRTLFDLTKITRTKFEGTKHNALDDAKMQATDVVRCYVGFKNLMDRLKNNSVKEE
ncbi:MAG: 3'-5' exoribonuclease [Magnetococcus sp. YQC-3]